MKKNILAGLSSLFFFNLIFWIGIYYLGGLSHLYYSKGVVNSVIVYVIISALAIAVFVSIVILMFKGRRTLKIISVILLIIIMFASAILSFFEMLFVTVFGTNGCSYTENIENYGKYDGYDPSYFPINITEDMTVVKFSYFYTYIDIDQVDIYLEIKFKDKETMDTYLSQTSNSFNDGKIISYQNPYNLNYTDIVADTHMMYSSKDGYLVSCIKFEGSEDYKYVEMLYNSISYSYDELTIIYNYTRVGNDIMIGNNPDKGEYYPKYLERFGVEWNPDNDFIYKYTEE